jgi:DNA processing protein
MKYLNALNKISGIGAKRMQTLLDFFGSSENAWNANLEDLKMSGIGEKMAEGIILGRSSINPDEEWKKLSRENIKIIPITSPDYPNQLKESARPPYLLYIRGDYDFNSAPMIAIVGARKCTAYGAQVAQTFARDLARAGITVVSGMALGIDSHAHRGALNARGKTIAVLGNSLDDENIYPRNNVNLAHEILENGVLVSEYAIPTSAGALTFPARNRIIAGMCLGTIIVEAEEKSGALITAQMALDDNREVFAVPGPIFSPSSRGTNNLIKSGAKLVSSVADILEELNLSLESEKNKIIPKIPENHTEEIILKNLSSEPVHIDNLSKAVKLQTADVASTLILMEMKGWVKNIGGQNYIIL